MAHFQRERPRVRGTLTMRIYTPDTRRPSGGSGGAPGDVGQRRQVLRRRHRASLEAAHLAGGRGQVQHRAPSDHPGHRGIAPEPIGVIHVLVAGETRTPLGGIGRAACGARSFPVRGSRRMNRTGSSRLSGLDGLDLVGIASEAQLAHVTEAGCRSLPPAFLHDAALRLPAHLLLAPHELAVALP